MTNYPKRAAARHANRVDLLLTSLLIEWPSQPTDPLHLGHAEYEDRVLAAGTGQIIATLMGLSFEHKTALTEWIDLASPNRVTRRRSTMTTTTSW